MRTSRSAKLTRMKTGEFTLCRPGSASDGRNVDDGKPAKLLVSIAWGGSRGAWQKHSPRKQAMPGALRNDADRQAELGIAAGKALLDEDVLSLEALANYIVERPKLISVDRSIDRTPPHMLFARGFSHEELIVWRATSVLAREADERAGLRDDTLVATHGLLVERCRPQVPVHFATVGKSVGEQHGSGQHMIKSYGG